MSKRLTNKENVRGLNEGKGDYYDTEKVQLQKRNSIAHYASHSNRPPRVMSTMAENT